MDQPTVSIIIPTYNYGHLIADTLSCLQNQQYNDWEAIIVDDGSADNTKSVVENFTRTDARFSYIYQDNTGVSIARNKGLRHAKGTYIQFLDADDLVSKEKILLQVSYLEKHPEVDLLNVNTYYFHTENPDKLYTDLSLTNTSTRAQVKGKGFNLILKLIKNNPIVINNPLFKRKILNATDHFVAHMHYLEDWDLWFRMALNNYRFDHLDDPKAYALVRAHSISASQQNTKIQEGEGFLRHRMKIFIEHSGLLDLEQKKTALTLNSKELQNTYKHLMATTKLRDIRKFISFFAQLQNPKMYFSCLIKSLNLRRKLC